MQLIVKGIWSLDKRSCLLLIREALLLCASQIISSAIKGGITGCSLLLCLIGEQSDEDALYALRLGCGYADPRALQKCRQWISLYICSLVFWLGYDHVRKLIICVRKVQVKVQRSAEVGTGRQQEGEALLPQTARKKDAYIGKIIEN